MPGGLRWKSVTSGGCETGHNAVTGRLLHTDATSDRPFLDRVRPNGGLCVAKSSKNPGRTTRSSITDSLPHCICCIFRAASPARSAGYPLGGWEIHLGRFCNAIGMQLTHPHPFNGSSGPDTGHRQNQKPTDYARAIRSWIGQFRTFIYRDVGTPQQVFPAITPSICRKSGLPHQR